MEANERRSVRLPWSELFAAKRAAEQVLTACDVPKLPDEPEGYDDLEAKLLAERKKRL
jgi:hypothetical protein